MAPEQLTAPDTVGPSADLYSISVMFYELLMDAPPQGHWQPPSGGRSGIPPGIDQLIEKSLSNRARSRPQSVAEYRKALKTALGPMGLVDWTTLYTPRRTAFDWKKVPQWVWWTMGAVVAIIAIAALMEEYGGGAPPDPYYGPDDEYSQNTSAPAAADMAPASPKSVAVIPPQQPGFSRLSGMWDDGSGSTWQVQVASNGQVQGQAVAGPSIGWQMVGAFSGDQFTFQSGANGVVMVQGQGQTDGCHINYQAYDATVAMNRSGQIHINHPAGGPCP
jgi:serine/threonine protein kinase